MAITQSLFFTSALLHWNDTENKREMPWKGEKDAYKIWISEIILQQTRVNQGLSYYKRFIEVFPDIKSLALAREEKVYKVWEGLGYYSRCKNLMATAKYIHEELDDQFPDQFEQILALKGIGPYTAAAIASFAYGLSYAVMDGNVSRVLARYFGESTPVNTTEGKKLYSALAQQLLFKNDAGRYNQAIMDFGAVICRPALPLCHACPLQIKCTARQTNKVALLPINTKTIKHKERFFNYLLVRYGQKYYIHKRTAKDIWQNLYEFILIETQVSISEKELIKAAKFKSLFRGTEYRITRLSGVIQQKLTHQKISARFIGIEIKDPLPESGNYHLVTVKQLKKLPFSKLTTSYLLDKNVSLNLGS